MQWYYSKNSTQLGPVAQSELISKLASGEVAPSDLVWKDGMGDWIPAAQVSELRPTAAAPATPGYQEVPVAPYTPPSANPAPAGQAYPVVVTVDPGKATSAMVLGIISLTTGLLCGCITGVPCGIIAIVFGNQFKKAAAFNPLLAQDLGKAKAGIIMGWIGIVLSLIITIVGVMVQFAAGAFNQPQ